MKKLLIISGVLLIILFSGCTELLNSLVPDEPVTSEMMNGLWEVIGVYDESDTSTNLLDTIILGYGSVSVPMYVNLNNSYDQLASTAGPLFLYLVYGKSNWTTFFGKLDQIFDYVDGRYFTEGEWGISDTANADALALKAKVMPPSMTTFAEILDLIPGLETAALKKYVIHHFTKIQVEMATDSTMTWEFTDNTDAIYYTQNDELNPDPWLGWTADGFSRCKIELKKKMGTLDGLMENLTSN